MNNSGVPLCGTIQIRRHSRHHNYSLFIIHYSLAQPVPTIILQITLLVSVKGRRLYRHLLFYLTNGTISAEVILMFANKLGIIEKGQDGAIFNKYLFRFNAKGACAVYQIDDLSDNSVPISRFVLDKSDIIAPHSNSVAFSNTRYCETDEFPLLYSNVYNNYAKTDSPMKGVTCVYRLERSGNMFSTTLLQLIEIGFTEDTVWKSSNGIDVRPYGNFAIDANNGRYYAFTMRDKEKSTRYFSFKLPDINSGKYDNTFDAKRVTLKKEDVIDFFDCEYHRYIQGACLHNGIIYSLEGFSNDKNNPAAIRLIDTYENNQKKVYYFSDFDLTIEPELIDFENDNCYYADSHGNVYQLIF